MNFTGDTKTLNTSQLDGDGLWWKDYSALIFILISGPMFAPLCWVSKLNSSFNGTLLCFHHPPPQKCFQIFWKKTLTSQNHLHAENWQTLNKNCSKEDWGFLQIIKSQGRSWKLQAGWEYFIRIFRWSDIWYLIFCWARCRGEGCQIAECWVSFTADYNLTIILKLYFLSVISGSEEETELIILQCCELSLQ